MTFTSLFFLGLLYRTSIWSERDELRSLWLPGTASYRLHDLMPVVLLGTVPVSPAGVETLTCIAAGKGLKQINIQHEMW